MRYSIYLCILFVLSILSCNSKQEDRVIESFYVRKDDLGRNVSIPVNPKRILSLTPSITELVYTFSDTSRLIGRSVWCDYPAGVKIIPAVNNYPLDIEGVVRLKPDLILVKQGMISVQELDKLEQLHLAVYVQKYDLLNEIYASTKTLVEIAKGDSATYKHWLTSMQSDTMHTSVQHAKTCLAVTSVSPIYVFGKTTFVSELIEQAGGKNCVETIQSAYPTVDVEYILRANPDVFIFNSTDQQKLFFETYPLLKQCKGYITNQLFVIDDSIMSRPGIRLPILKDSLVSIFSK